MSSFPLFCTYVAQHCISKSHISLSSPPAQILPGAALRVKFKLPSRASLTFYPASVCSWTPGPQPWAHTIIPLVSMHFLSLTSFRTYTHFPYLLCEIAIQSLPLSASPSLALCVCLLLSPSLSLSVFLSDYPYANLKPDHSWKLKGTVFLEVPSHSRCQLQVSVRGKNRSG